MQRTTSQKDKDHLLYEGYKLLKDKILVAGGTSSRCVKLKAG